MRMLSVANFQNDGQVKEGTKDTKLYERYKTVWFWGQGGWQNQQERLKIHYVGYSTCFDEWTPFRADRGSGYFPFVRSEKLFIPSENSLEDRKESFHGQLVREIKKKLWSGRREDPDINIDLNVDQDIFMEGLGSVLPGVLQRGKMVYQLESNSQM